MILIVGLGNPDKKYEKTYHNIGFLSLDAINAALGGSFSKSYGKSLISEVFYMGEKIILAKPKTYMNLSGEAVVAIKNKFKIDNQDILIILDDIDLPVGKTRYRNSGSAGTHNGLKSIISLVGDNNIPRLRIGIGNNKNMELADYVLSQIKDEDMPALQDSILQAADFVLHEFIESKKR